MCPIPESVAQLPRRSGSSRTPFTTGRHRRHERVDRGRGVRIAHRHTFGPRAPDHSLLWLPRSGSRCVGDEGRASDRHNAASRLASHNVVRLSVWGSSAGRGGLYVALDLEPVLARVFEDGEALVARVLVAGRKAQTGDGSHSPSMKTCWGDISYKIRRLKSFCWAWQMCQAETVVFSLQHPLDQRQWDRTGEATLADPAPSPDAVVDRSPFHRGLDWDLAASAPILRPPGCEHGVRSRPRGRRVVSFSLCR